jgi:hypothetical protein
MPQPPQFPGSLAVLMQPPLQDVIPDGHTVQTPNAPGTLQPPVEHVELQQKPPAQMPFWQ